jgi:hypothetical protein
MSAMLRAALKRDIQEGSLRYWQEWAWISRHAYGSFRRSAPFFVEMGLSAVSLRDLRFFIFGCATVAGIGYQYPDSRFWPQCGH